MKEDIMNVRNISVRVVGLAFCIYALVCMANMLVEEWEQAETARVVVTGFAIFGWLSITYNVVTLKYKWIKRIAGE